MARKKKKVILSPMDKIKKMESKKRKVLSKSEEKISFGVWWSMRNRLIPKNHQKEVIFANFEAWGLSRFEKMSVFDAALVKYGIKI